MTTLADIIRRRTELLDERSAKETAYASFLKAAAGELETLAEGEGLIVAGLDLERIQRARLIIEIRGVVSKPVQSFDFHRGYRDSDTSGVRAKCLADAKADLADGGTKIASSYFGVKNYDGFGDQRNDGPYGTGPRHGSIVFSIGLTRTLYDRVRTGPHLEEWEIEDALYLLSALPKIEQLQAEAKAAA